MMATARRHRTSGRSGGKPDVDSSVLRLLVLGPHGRGGRVRARLLGTTADRVLREADVPCLVVRRMAPMPWRGVVFRTQPLDALTWGVILVVGTSVILGGELDKWWSRRTGRLLG